MDDGYVLDGYGIDGEDRGQGGDGAALVDDIAVDPVVLLHRTVGGEAEGIPIVAALLEHPADIAAVALAHAVPGFDHPVQEGVHHLRDVGPVFEADGLPHGGRGRRDPGDIPESSRGDHLHVFLFAVQIVHGIDQGSRDHMGEMADGGGDEIMLVRIQYQRDRLQRQGKIMQPGDHLFRNLRLRGQDVVSVFKQVVRGVGKPGFFGTRHGVSAHELRGHAQPPDLPVDGTLDGTHVGQQAGGREHLLQKREHLKVALRRRAEEQNVAGSKLRIRCVSADRVGDPQLHGVSAGLLRPAAGKDPALRIHFFQVHGQGASDEAQPDKSVCHDRYRPVLS